MIDFDIREALCAWLDGRHEKIRIIDELRVGRARADIVTVTDRLTGYEIKGDTDSYARLPMQVREYSRYFEENYIVIGKSHRKSAESNVPEYWGIICVFEEDGGTVVEVVRAAQTSPKYSWTCCLNLLWNSELRNILAANKLPKLSGQRKTLLKKSILSKVPKDTLRGNICEELFERDWTEKGMWTIKDGQFVKKDV